MGPRDTWHRMGAWLRQLGGSIGVVPKAIIVISAHWEAEEFTVSAHSDPPLLYDYYGFPEHTYHIKYQAPGSPVLAREICDLLATARIDARLDPGRGFDHGVFIPFKLIYPNADVPIVQLSLKAGLDPALHIGAGCALEPLRRQGVLIVGSGMSYHNLSKMLRGSGGGDLDGSADRFDEWLTEAVCVSDHQLREEKLRQWYLAPGAREAHPREEHLLPLMVAAGSAGRDVGTRIFADRIMGRPISAYQFGTYYAS
jgi:aromatic ring-opening dioxygenase catalytic subunit (LigB family)